MRTVWTTEGSALPADVLTPLLDRIGSTEVWLGRFGSRSARRLGSTLVVARSFDTPAELIEAAAAATEQVTIALLGACGTGAVDWLRSLRDHSPPGSRIHFADRTLGVGLAASIQASPLIVHTSLGRSEDVPHTLRSSGWTVTTLVRLRAGRPPPLRTFVVGEAQARSARPSEGAAADLGHIDPMP